ncbi:PAS domain [Flavobacteriaceae bacterium]
MFLLTNIHFLLNFTYSSLVGKTMLININTDFFNLLHNSVILLLILTLIVLGLIFSFLKINTILLNKDNLSLNDSEKREYKLCLLFFGLVIPFIEIIFEICHIRPKSMLINNFAIGIFFLALFLLSEKSKYIYNRIQNIYIFLFCLYFILIGYNIIQLPEDPIPSYAFIVAFFFSYIILKPLKRYLIFTGLIVCYLIIIYAFDLVNIKKIGILFNYSILAFIINYIRHVSLTKIQEKYNFTNEIVNKGNSLTIATNKSGEVTFCSETITSILGYTQMEVIGMGFWKLTEDPEFIGIDYHEDFIDNRLYVRKLKCKNGEYKFIQWIDKKFEDDITIGIGQDITNEINLRNQYENLIQTAVDIIFEVDYKGNFTFVNDYMIKATGYTKEEFLNKKFYSIIRKDYVFKIMRYYQNFSVIENDFTTLEFPIIKKNGEEIWISQNVFIRRNNFGKVNGYSGIARDITLLKNIEIDKANRQAKIQKYSQALKKIAILNHSNNDNLEFTIDTLLQETSSTLGVNRASYWEYEFDKIVCNKLYDSKTNTFQNGIYFTKNENLKYFEKIENKLQIVLTNVRAHISNNKKNKEYILDNNIFSTLDTPIFIDGELKGVLSFESTFQVKEWDNEDINFSKSVSDLIVIAISSQIRAEIERKLAYKSELLLIINQNINKFLLQKNSNDIFKGIINEIGIITKAERISYLKKEVQTGNFNQNYRWLGSLQGFDNVNPQLQNLTFSEFKSIINELTPETYFNFCTTRIRNEKIKNFIKSLDIKSFLLLPVFVKNELDGFFVFDDTTQERIWSIDEVSIMQILIKNIATSIERNTNESIIEESEERFRLLANNIPGTVYLSNYDEKYSKIYLNDEIKKLTGYAKSDFLENKIFLIDLILPEDIEYVKLKNKIALEEKKSLHITYRIKHKNQSIVWVEEFGDSIIKNGEIAFMEGILIDITEKKNNESIIKEKDLAEAANKAKSEFLANMSHEIRTPLNGIIGYTDLLMNSKLESTQKQYMSTINQSANILMEVVNDILDFSKIESGKLELNIEKYCIKDIIFQIKELINYQAQSKNLELKFTIEENVPIYIWVDYIRLKQVLINLLTNAVKFTQAGKIELTISILESQKSFSTIRFSVKDTGIGIRKNNQKIIFQAFSQEDSSTTKKFGGTGLGLTISNQLLSLMNSHLQINSQYNVGSTFFFDIKLKSSNKTKIEIIIPEKNVVLEKKILRFDNETPRILIVEDNKINMLLTKTLLKQIIPKAILSESVNGENAVIMTKDIRPDLIFMDIQMPVMNGYEATKEIRKIENIKDVIIIALTAGTVVGEKEKCMEAGMNDYVSKPIIKKSLEDILEKWLITKNEIL